MKDVTDTLKSTYLDEFESLYSKRSSKQTSRVTKKADIITCIEAQTYDKLPVEYRDTKKDSTEKDLSDNTTVVDIVSTIQKPAEPKEINKNKKQLYERLYERAWDSIEDRFVTPEEVDRAELHAKNRYFSRDFNIKSRGTYGDVLIVREKSWRNRRYFASIGENTGKYRVEARRAQNKHDDSIHKLAEKLMKEIQYIHVPSIETYRLFNVRTEILNSQILELNDIVTQKKDKKSGKIPDLTATTIIKGKKVPLHIEIVYSNEVNEAKRNKFRENKINCIAIDLYDLKYKTELSHDELVKEIKYRLVNTAYWVSNEFREIVEHEAFSEWLSIIDRSNGITQSKYQNQTKEKRYFIYNHNLPKHCPYYKDIKSECDKIAINIGDCKHCRQMLGIDGYDNVDINDPVKLYCACSDELNPLHISTLILKRAHEIYMEV